MDQITKSFLQAHKKEYGINDLNDQDAFEHFVNRCIINKYTTERFDPSDITTKAGEVGIDGAAICVNDHLITSLDEWNAVNTEGIEVKFIFTQAKTSEKFEGGDIGTFISGVRSFFADNKSLQLHNNEYIKTLIDIKDKIFANSIILKNSPTIEMYYVSCGTWNDDNNLQKRIDLDLEPLRNSPAFEKVLFYPYDASKIQRAYRELKKKISKNFTMEKKVSFANIEGVRQAYIGLVKCKEYISVITDAEDNLLKNIFEDNVRDFQGYNQVNSEIRETIKNPKDQQRFAILNNGITIVAKKIEVEGDKITIHDYQIVNGCQTSYVLYNCQNDLNDDTYVVIKLIEINDSHVSDRVIFTTNRQTEIKSEAFISINQFQKGLEEYYNSISEPHKLYYERRSKQYDLIDDVQKDRVVTIPNQIKAYLAMFLNEPQSVHRYYGELINTYKNRLFREDDSYSLYHISAFYQFFINSELSNGNIDRKYKTLKPYLLFTMRLLICNDRLIAGNKKSQEKTAARFIFIMNEESEMRDYLKRAVSCLDECMRELSSDVPYSQMHRSKELRNALFDKCKKLNNALKSQDFLKKGDYVHAVVCSISRHFLSLELKTTDDRKNGYIHISKVAKKYIYDLSTEVEIGAKLQPRIISEEYDQKYGWEMSLINE